MQEISRQRKRGTFVRGAAASCPHLAWCTVEHIAHDRVPQRRHVDADLMGAAGIDLHFDQGELSKRRVEPTDDVVVRDGFAAVYAASAHAYAAYWVTADGRVDGAPISLGPS